MALSKIKSDSIDSIDAAKVPNLDASKIATGTVDNARITLDAAEIPNLDAAKITTGDIALARLGNAPATDTTSIQNDISLLALQNAINGNLSAHGLKNSWIEQFENSTYIENLSTADRDGTGEYMSSSVPGPAHTVTIRGTAVRSSTESQFGGYSMYSASTGSGLTFPSSTAFDMGSGDMTLEYFSRPTHTDDHIIERDVDNYPAFLMNSSNAFFSSQGNSSWDLVSNLDNGNETLNVWQHYATCREGNVWTTYREGVRVATYTGSGTMAVRSSGNTYLCVGFDDDANACFRGYLDEVRISKGIARYSGASYTVPTAQFVTDAYTSLLLHMDDTGLTDSSGTTTSAAGSFTSTAIVPQDTTNKSSVGLVMLYKDQAGTNTLNTDIIAKVRANTGQAYQTLVLAGAGTYSDSLKIAIAPAIAVTAGQALSYEISFANQALSSKEARIHGIAMTY